MTNSRIVRAALVTFAICESAFAQSVLTTIAGTDWLFPADGRPAVNAPLNSGSGASLDVAADRNGNFYIADDGNSMVLRVGSDGIVSIVAGNGLSFPSGDGGLAINAGLFSPLSIALDSAGNAYVAQYSGQIRKITPDGIITNIAGTEDSGFSGDGGPALKAQLYAPYGLLVDSAGNIYVADTYNARVRKITPDGVIRTIAGGGTDTRDGIPATSAKLIQPQRLALDSAGNLYVADLIDHRVRKVGVNGMITTVAGGGVDPGDGIAATTSGILPAGIAIDPAGNLYIVDLYSSNLRKVDTRGTISTIAGVGKAGFSGDGGPPLKAAFRFGIYCAVTVDSAGNILVTDNGNGRVRRIARDGSVSTVAGNGLFHFSGNGGSALTATLDNPTGLAGDAAGNLYFTEPFANRIRRIAPDGTLSVVAGTGAFGYSGDGGPATAASLGLPEYLTFAPDGSLVFSDAVNCVLRSINTRGIISTVAGTGRCTYNGDFQTPDKASFSSPHGVDYDSAGDLIIADSANNLVRAIVAPGSGSFGGMVVSLAGTGIAGYSGDGDIALGKAEVNNPTCVRAHGNGVYFCDAGNNVIRYIDFNSFVISTVAGNGKAGYLGDGGPATKASLQTPSGIIFDKQGNMYIADTANSVIRKVDVVGTITTVAGAHGLSDVGDGLAPTKAFIGGPTDLFIRPNGNIVFTDIYYHRVREILSQPPSIQTNPRALAFTAAAGSSPLDQDIAVAASITGVPFTVTSDSGQWLSASISSGRTPASIRATASPASLAPGTYSGGITVATSNATPASTRIPVAFTVTAAGQPSLSVSPGSLTFPFVRQAPARSRLVSVSNTGGGSLSFSVTTRTATGGTWLQATPSTGTLAAFGAAIVNITANPSSVGPGTYSGSVTIASVSPAQSIVVPVTMTVTTVSQTIVIPETGLSFFSVEGSGLPSPQKIDILNAGSGQMQWSVSTATRAGGSWLSVFPRAGQTDAASDIVPQVRVSVNPQGLTAGTWYGTIEVSAPGATNDPQFVSVVLTVLPAGTNLGEIVQPSGMLFSAVAAAGSPGSQTITVQGTSSTPVNFTSGVVTDTGDNVFQTVPQSGTVTASQPARIVVQPNIKGLAPGFYRGTLTLSFSDGNARAVSLLLVVIPSVPGGVSAVSRMSPTVAEAQTSCIPDKLAPVFTSLTGGGSQPVGYPGIVEVRVVDNCANPMTTGGVATTFTNGDPPLGLTSLKNGSWVATWIPRKSSSEVTVTATASIPELKLTGQAHIKVGARTAEALPVIDQDGIVNAASFVALAPVAPGSLVAVFGSKLAQSPSAAGTVPLPVNLAGTGIVLGGKEAPLLFASDGQVNAVVPYGIPINTAQQVIASRSFSLSVPQSVTIAATAPGVFTTDGTRGIVVDIDPAGNSTVVDPAHPAKIGHALVIYCTGLGEVDPPVATGSAAPSNPPSKTVNPVTVTIGGIDAKVLFAGLTPTQVGLYQVNVEIPAGVAPGAEVALVLTTDGQVSRPVTIAIQ